MEKLLMEYWKIDLQNIAKWEETLDWLKENIRLSDMDIEENLSQSLILSIYGTFEDCMKKLIVPIETKTKESFNDFKKNKNTSTIKLLKEFVEGRTTIKFNKYLFKDIETLNYIRNIFIHDDAWPSPSKQYFSNLESMKKFVHVKNFLGNSKSPIIYADFEDVEIIIDTIKLFTDDIAEQQYWEIKKNS